MTVSLETYIFLFVCFCLIMLAPHTIKTLFEFGDLSIRTIKSFWEACQIIYLFWLEECKILKLKRKLKPGDIFIFSDKNKLDIFDSFYFNFYELNCRKNKIKSIMYLRSEILSRKRVFVFLCGEKTIEVDMHYFTLAYNKKRIIKLE